MLIAARFVQGIGASLLFPVGISVISNAFPVAERGKAIGNVYGVGAIGTAVGPFVGGLLTDLIDWRWVFFFNVPFTLAALPLTLRNVGESRDTSAQRIDLRGLVAGTLGVAAFTYPVVRTRACAGDPTAAGRPRWRSRRCSPSSGSATSRRARSTACPAAAAAPSSRPPARC